MLEVIIAIKNVSSFPCQHPTVKAKAEQMVKGCEHG